MDRPESKKSDSRSSGQDLSVDLLAILDRRKWIIFASGIFGLIVGASYLLFMPPKYESTSQILLMQNDPATMATQMTSGENSISEDLLATHMSLLQSKRLVTDALTNAGLLELPSILDEIDQNGSPVGYVIDNLYVTRGGEGAARDARVLSIAFRHTNPEDSKLVSDAILKEYKEFVDAKFRGANEETVELIGKARTELETEIETTAREYREFRSSAPILASTEGGANIHAIRYEELAAELSQLLLDQDEARSRIKLVKEGLARLDQSDGPELQKLALIDERNAERLGILVTVERGEAQTAAFQALQPERMAGAQTEYTSLLSLKAQLRQALIEKGPKHPQVQVLQTQVSEMEAFFKTRQAVLGDIDDAAQLTPDDVMKAYVGLLENDLYALEQRKVDIEKQMQQAGESAKALVDFELKDEELVRRLTRQEDLFNSVLERLRDINMQADSTALIQEVIEEPEVGSKVSPRAPIAAALAMLTSMLLAGSTILLAELSDKSIHSAEDLEMLYGTNILSHIPDFEREPEARQLIKKIARNKPKVSPTLVAFHEPKSKLSESFRTIRTQMMFNLAGKKRLIAVTSPSQADGKSTITANLAISLANTGKSVLLMDADMRRPNVHNLLGLSNATGLVDVIDESLDFHDCCQAGPDSNITVLTTGKVPDNPAELLAGDKFKNLLDAVREKFDYVILDCPPILPVSDPTIIAPLVDSVLVVTSLMPDGLPKAKQCVRALKACEAKLAGLVVNRAGKSGCNYAYGSYQSDYATNPYYQEVTAARS